MLHVPAATVPVHVSPLTSLTEMVTLPVGVPAPGRFTVTEKFTVTALPTKDGSGRSLVIVAVVAALLAVCAVPAEALPAKFVSPTYVAVSVFEPGVVSVIEHVPEATVPVHVLPLASLTVTVTLPVGVPPPGAVGVTEKFTVTACPTADGSGR